MPISIDDALHMQVKSIVDELEAAASGSLYKLDGEYVIIADLDEWKNDKYQEKVEGFRKEHPEDTYDLQENGFDTYEEAIEYNVGTVEDIDEPEEISLSEYIEDQSLGDLRFEVDSDKDLHGAKVLFCCGGPNIWVADDEVRGYWGSSRVEMSLDSNARSELFSYFEEMWNLVK